MNQSNPLSPLFGDQTSTYDSVVHGANMNPIKVIQKLEKAASQREASNSHQTKITKRGPINAIEANRQHISLHSFFAHAHPTSPSSAHRKGATACHPTPARHIMQYSTDKEYWLSHDVSASMHTSHLLQFRKEKDHFFKHATQSPVPEEVRHDFEGLSYFEPSDDYVFTARLEPVEPAEIQINTTTGEERTYLRVATASITVDREDATVALFSSGHDSLFLPFRDATSGTESYEAGRYIDVQSFGEGTALIDFNYAYAPFCAYNDQYSCALPPHENWLSVAIPAGERNPA